MHSIETRQYRARAFARITGVTVRTLQYYDRLGLLRPRRTQAGYRLYGDADQEALRLIRVLKFIGLPLKQIRMMLRGKPAQLAEALRTQQGVLKTRRAALDQAIGTLAELERILESRGSIAGARLQTIVRTISPQTTSDQRTQYVYQLKGKVERMKDNLGRAKQFADLCRDIEASLEEDPSSAGVQQLAARWIELGAEPMGFDPLVHRAAGQMFREAFASAGDLKPFVPRFEDPKIATFIQNALAVRPQPDNSASNKT